MLATLDVPTPVGEGRWLVHGPDHAVALLALGPGHSGHVQVPDLVALAACAGEDLQVAIWSPPFVVAGLKGGFPPAKLDQAWTPAVTTLREHRPHATRLVLGGHSAGSRVACRTASALDADGVIALSFPLHPPGRPESSRAEELVSAGVPVLVVQGAVDPFGGTDEVVDAIGTRPQFTVHGIPGAGHSLVPTKRADPDGSRFAGAIAAAAAFARCGARE